MVVPLFVNYSNLSLLLFDLPRWPVRPHAPGVPEEGAVGYTAAAVAMPSDLMKESAEDLVPNVTL